MPPRITDSQRQAVLALLAQGCDRRMIAAQVGVTPGQVSAVAAHVKMGTYEKYAGHDTAVEAVQSEARGRVYALLEGTAAGHRKPKRMSGRGRILIGTDAETDEEVVWNPDPSDGTANPHMLILGESGFGKTYAIGCILTELAQQGMPSVVFDYGQGFAVGSSPGQFVEYARPVEIKASHEGVAINPLQLFPSDVHGPVNVAQRVADTFQRVYPQIGVQQHAVLRQAVLDVMVDEEIVSQSHGSWNNTPPPFAALQEKLCAYAENPKHPQRRIASAVASHISTMFVFNTFQDNGLTLDWQDMLDGGGVRLLSSSKVLNTHWNGQLQSFSYGISLGLSNHLAQVPCAALSSLMKPIRSPLLPGRRQKNCCVKVENSDSD